MRTQIRAIAIFAAAIFVAAACGGAAAPSPTPEAPPRLIVGAIHVGSIKDAGYNQMHHEALVEMTKKVSGVKLIEAENVPEGPDVQRVIEQMIQQGAKLIFPQSFGYMDPTLEIAKKYPDVKFAHPAGFKQADNFGTYWAVSDQLHYALGAAAGKLTKSGKIGFIGGFPIPQIISSVHAFHNGARSTNKTVQTVAVFNNTWLDPAKEAGATNALADQGVDVVAMIVDSPITVVQTAEKRGMRSIGYHSKALSEFAPNGWVSGVNFQFGDYFTKLANDVISGKYKSEQVRGDLKSGMVSLAPYGKNVPDDVKKTIDAALADFSSGKLKSPYQGPIKDQSGTLRIKEGEVPDANFVNTVNWFPEGVIGQTK